MNVVMKNYKSYLVVCILILLASHTINAIIRPKFKNGLFDIELSGYVKSEGFWDSRQVFGFHDDHVLIFPEKEILDKNGDDINAKGQFDNVPIETRLHFDIKALKINAADIHGIIEVDFFGGVLPVTDIDIPDIPNVLRMRHAFITYSRDKLTVIAGQTWHPMYMEECYAHTIALNGGSPIDPFARNPQIRLRYHFGPVDFIAAAISQTDFLSDGPIGLSTTYIRNAVVPNLHGQVQGYIGEHVLGAGIDYKRLVPRLQTNKDFKARESINSVSAIAFAAFNWPSFFLHSKVSYIENGTDLVIPGGFAVHTIDEVTDRRTYTNLRKVSIWADMAYTKHKKIEPGLFIGYIKNIGASNTIIRDETDAQGNITERRSFGFGNDIDNIIRIQPRISWRIKNITVGAEYEYTRAAFGTIDSKGKVQNTKPVANNRLLIAVFYNY